MALKRKDPEVGKDVLKKHLVGGVFRRRQIEKFGKGKSEHHGLGRTYVATPPPEGWPGGDPEKNGWKP